MTGTPQFRVPFIRPVFPSAQELSADLARIVEGNWYTNFGPYEREFAGQVASYVGSDFFSVTFANATVGLIASVSTILGRGDGTKYVVIPSFTFAAGAEAIEWAGYRPLLIDIEPDTLQPSLNDARTALSVHGQKIAGILLCNTFGIGNAAVSAWEEAAREYGLPLIIDSAAGFGSLYPDGSRVGTAGTCEVFSFHATKPFAIGEGGAVVTRDPALALRLAEFTNYGFHDGKGAASLGLNGKLQELSAAIGLRQFDRFEHALTARRSALARYRTALGEAVTFPAHIELSSVCFATMLMPTNAAREQVRDALLAAGIEGRIYYSPPLHRQPHFTSSARASQLPTTNSVSEIAISIPVYENMEPADESRIIEIIRSGVNS